MKPSVISRNPEVLSGAAVLTGTRVPVRNLIDCLEGGYSIDGFLDDFPSVSREQVIQFLELAKEKLVKTADGDDDMKTCDYAALTGAVMFDRMEEEDARRQPR